MLTLKRVLRIFAVLIFVGTTSVGFLGGYFIDIGREIIESGKTYPSGYISSIIFVFNFLGMVAAGILFLLVLNENKVLSFVSIIVLAFISNFILGATTRYSENFFHVPSEREGGGLGELWGSFLNVFGAKWYALGLFFSYLVWLFLRTIFKKKKWRESGRRLLCSFSMIGERNKLFYFLEVGRYFWIVIKVLAVYAFIVGFSVIVLRAPLISASLTQEVYKLIVEFQFFILLLSHFLAGMTLGVMAQKENVIILVCSVLLTLVTYFFTWAKDFPVSFVAAYFFITYLSARVCKSEP